MHRELTLTFSALEIQQYARHFTLPEVGVEGQKKLKAAKVLCVGAGGLGCPVLLYLTAAGIGTLGIVDHDRVEISNLHRQVLYNHDDIGLNKAIVASNKLQKNNPSIKIIAHIVELNSENAFNLLAQYDVIVDCTDNFATRYLINDLCFHLNKPNVFAAISQFEGQCTVFTMPGAPCYRCLYDEPPLAGLIPNCAEGGVLGILPGVLGTIQAAEVIKLLLGTGTMLVGRILLFDALAMTFRELPIQVDPDCRLCIHHQPFIEIPRYEKTCKVESNDNAKLKQISPKELEKILKREKIFVLDVRDDYEHDICHISNNVIPLAELPDRLHELDKNLPIIVYCKSGTRSKKAALLLNESGFMNVSHLTGGILAWIKDVDPSLTKY